MDDVLTFIKPIIGFWGESSLIPWHEYEEVNCMHKQ